MRRLITSITCLLLVVTWLSAQSIKQHQYWIDNDFRNNKTVASSETDFTVNLSLADIQCGLHFFNYRALNSDGKWGNLMRTLFYIPEREVENPVITAYEYWIDDDTANKKTGSDSKEVYQLSFDLSKLEEGEHVFSFRSKNSEGKWSGLSRLPFSIVLDEDGDPEPYAALSDDNKTLTFYYDGKKESRNGMSIGPFQYNYPNGVDSGWYGQREIITNVVFDASFANYSELTSTAYWFYGCNKLFFITGIENLNTSNVTKMDGMFYECSSLTSLDVSNFNTAKVTSMSSMFSQCSGLKSLDVTNFNTANVTSMGSMFSYCSGLKSLDVTNFNTSNVTYMRNMFSFCSGLTSLDVSNFNTSKVKDMAGMFWTCSGLTNLDLSNFNTANVTDMQFMFEGCLNLKNLNVKNFNTSKVTNMSRMFEGCYLASLDVSNFNTNNVTNMSYMFNSCHLTSLDVSNFNTCNVTDMRFMFQGCSMASLDLSNFNTSKVTNMENMFAYSYSLTTIYCNDVWTSINSTDMFKDCASLKGAINFDSSKTDITYANPTTGYFTRKSSDEGDESDIIKFADSKTKEICLKYWDTDEDGKLSKTEAAAVLWIGNAFVESEITSFNEFFYFTAVTDIDDAAFRKCKNLQEITLPNSATSIGKQTFAYCQNLTKVVMSNSMSSIGDYAFMGCSSLASIDFTDNLTKIGDGAFENCSSLSTISIPESVFYIGGSPFDTCSGLTSINVDSGNMRYCSIDGVLFDKACTKIVQYPIGKKGSEYAIPATVTTIGEGAFICSANLHSITIPEGVMTIELGAFMDCTGLESITIPQSVESLAKYCFYGCSSLKSVTSMIVNPFEIESNVFETGNGIFTTATLYTPMRSASKYQSTGGWKNFKKFMPIGDVNGDNAINDTDVKEETGYILGNPSKTFVKAAADMNGDGVINIVDVVLMNALKAK